MSDRIAVMYRGQIVAIVDGRTADKNEVGLLMATGGERDADGRGTGDDRMTAGRAPTRDRAARLAPRPGRSSPLPVISIVLSLLVGAVVIIVSELLVTGERSTRACRSTAYGALVEGAVGSSERDRQHARRHDAAAPRRPGGRPRRSRPACSTSAPRASS